MKLSLYLISVALLAISAVAVAPRKAVIVSYPDETPDSIINHAMDVIREAGGVITHEYTLFKGFAATASAKVLESVSTLGEAYPPLIEEDGVVTVEGEINDHGLQH
jgi:hypothetical protein